ncbi:MAG: AI-2E family transporter [Patescibacteria group bacterium]|nr:AI-2E family transporter [Patescibacteria group bacterium]
MLNIFRRKKTYIQISPSIVVFTIFFLLGLYFLYQILDILAIFFIGFIIMVALSPAVDKVEKKLHSRLAGIIIVYILVVLVLTSLLAFLLPPLASQLLQSLKILNFPYLQEEIANLKFSAQELNGFAGEYGSSIGAVFDLVMSTLTSLFTTLTFFVISFYLMVDEPKLHLKISWLTKDKKHIKLARKFLDDIKTQLGGWVRGEIILMTIIGVMTYLALTIIGLPYVLPLALIAGILELLPNIGPTLSAIPAVGIALLNYDLTTALIVGASYYVIQLFENNLLVPRVLSKNADVNPLVTMMSILVGFKLYGVIGGLLSIPIYIVLRTVYSYWIKYQKKLKPNW